MGNNFVVWVLLLSLITHGNTRHYFAVFDSFGTTLRDLCSRAFVWSRMFLSRQIGQLLDLCLQQFLEFKTQAVKQNVGSWTSCSELRGSFFLVMGIVKIVSSAVVFWWVCSVLQR